MRILTERGWMPLQIPTHARIEEAPPRYRGPLPSLECRAYVAKLDNEHVEWLAKREAELAEHEAPETAAA